MMCYYLNVHFQDQRVNAQDVEQGQLEDIGTFKEMWASCCASTQCVLEWISMWFNDSSVGGEKSNGTCVLDLRSFVVNKLPEDGSFVPKRVVVDT